VLDMNLHFILKPWFSALIPKDSWPIHNTKYIQSISKIPQSSNSSNIVQKSKF
jgi:hypothetical protein